MNQDKAEALISAVEAAQARIEFASSRTACKATGVPFPEYKEARLMVYGLNGSV